LKKTVEKQIVTGSKWLSVKWFDQNHHEEVEKMVESFLLSLSGYGLILVGAQACSLVRKTMHRR